MWISADACGTPLPSLTRIAIQFGRPKAGRSLSLSLSLSLSRDVKHIRDAARHSRHFPSTVGSKAQRQSCFFGILHTGEVLCSVLLFLQLFSPAFWQRHIRASLILSRQRHPIMSNPPPPQRNSPHRQPPSGHRHQMQQPPSGSAGVERKKRRSDLRRPS
jgi:hypothetical protein